MPTTDSALAAVSAAETCRPEVRTEPVAIAAAAEDSRKTRRLIEWGSRIVAATSGVTQVIDPNGNRVSSLPITDEGVLVAEVGREKGLTFYTRMGWAFPWVGMMVGVLWVLWLFVGGLIKRLGERRKQG